MRHVYPTDQIPHKWAHQLQEDARNPQGNLYFRGPTIYSYRDSWPLARIYLKGKTARRKDSAAANVAHASRADTLVLTNSDKYSNTTAQHQYAVNRAASHLPQIAVPHPAPRFEGSKVETAAHSENIAYLEKSIRDAAARAMRRTTESAVQRDADDAARAHRGLADYLIFFNIRRKMPAMPGFAAAFERARRIENPDPASVDKRERASARRREIKKAAEARKHERRNLILDPCARTDWRLFGAFDAAGGNYWRIPGPCMLRVVDDEIITSLGARVPLAAAPMVWNLVQRARNAGGYESAGFGKALRSAGRVHIGDYPLDRIDADGTLHAGCHRIPFSELAMMARTLKLEVQS